MHGNPRGRRLHLEPPCVDVAPQVGLVQQHDRGGAARPGQDERALDAPWVEVAVQARDQEDGVDVGRQHLGLGGGPRRLAHEGALPR